MVQTPPLFASTTNIPNVEPVDVWLARNGYPTYATAPLRSLMTSRHVRALSTTSDRQWRPWRPDQPCTPRTRSENHAADPIPLQKHQRAVVNVGLRASATSSFESIQFLPLLFLESTATRRRDLIPRTTGRSIPAPRRPCRRRRRAPRRRHLPLRPPGASPSSSLRGRRVRCPL